ncbi:hypothetical protein [Paenibacillus lutrae]|uniref:Uncharacterized protein n=1 Tax=Paenibacillus lutrae TaxID=2078573 RepID=A0A7X3FHS9_9BACL|nr:hypothetical protein [Paenibacillus lutrae]MVO99852.1 hypothetical protein [Paenibacillus lutrae]
MKETDQHGVNKLLDYALTKQMVHDLDMMSSGEAKALINKFFNLFGAANKRLFTNAKYDNGLSWSSIMKETPGVIYFDTGVVVVTRNLIGILWIADKG